MIPRSPIVLSVIVATIGVAFLVTGRLVMHEPGNTPTDPEAGSVVTPCSDANCEPRDIAGVDLFSGVLGSNSAAFEELPAATVQEVLEKGLRSAEASPVHLAVRGTVSGDSVRCEWRGIARTTEQREAAIRFWLDLSATDPLPSASEVERRFQSELDRINPIYPGTVRSNFRAIAQGGLSTDFMFLTCYLDYTIHEYLLGPTITGTATLTAAYDRQGEARSYELYRIAHDWGEFGDEVLMNEGEYEKYLNEVAQDVELILGIIFEDRESIVMLAPMGAHNAIAIEAWQAVGQWDLQEDDGGSGAGGQVRSAGRGPRAQADPGEPQEPHRHGGGLRRFC